VADRLHTIALISAEPWDDVWRRNQHIASQIIRLGLAERLIFICPAPKLRHQSAFEPERGIRVVTPHLVLPRYRGGVELLARELRTRFLRDADALWINNALVGMHCLRSGLPSLYDVTDDWRTAHLTELDRARLIAAENALAGSVKTTVCSEVLRDRWFERYGVRAPVIHNGVDAHAHAAAQPIPLPGRWPHVVYVGTLHHERLDLDLLSLMGHTDAVGTIHLVGPDHLDSRARRRLERTSHFEFHGPVPHTEVPAWMASADVLVCPHRVDPFTLSLDAIKSFEYVASGRPVVATPTSGFQALAEYEGVHVVDSASFVGTVAALARDRTPTIVGRGREHDWSIRAQEFASQLSSAEGPRG
jgi:teichuronic acid biosynthesis glycosyltransferase TuaH